MRHLELIAALHATALELGELRKRRPLRRYRDVALGPHGGLLQERLFGGWRLWREFNLSGIPMSQVSLLTALLLRAAGCCSLVYAFLISYGGG